MNQIVFLVGAFVVLVQLHSTAAVSSRDRWNNIKTTILSRMKTIQTWVEHLKEDEEDAWKDANVEEPAKWPQGTTALIEQLNQTATELSELIDDLSETSSAKLNEILQGIDGEVARTSLNFNEVGENVEHAATGTKQEIDDSVDEGLEELKNLIETETVNLKNILNKASKKKSKSK